MKQEAGCPFPHKSAVDIFSELSVTVPEAVFVSQCQCKGDLHISKIYLTWWLSGFHLNFNEVINLQCNDRKKRQISREEANNSTHTFLVIVKSLSRVGLS